MIETSIMVVDDNVGLTKTMSLVFKKQGFTVVTAHSGLDAINQIELGVKTDIIFLDIKMPKLNGVETFKRLKKIVPNARVIMMTAYAVENLVQEALDEGAYSIIYKPFDFDYLFSLIDKIRSTSEGALTLIVDDSLPFIKDFKDTLCQRGYTVNMAISCSDAFKEVREKKYDIVFIDASLIQRDIHRSFEKISKMRPSFPIIIIGSAETTPKEIERFLLQGGQGYLRKPINTKRLLTLMESILQTS